MRIPIGMLFFTLIVTYVLPRVDTIIFLGTLDAPGLATLFEGGAEAEAPTGFVVGHVTTYVCARLDNMKITSVRCCLVIALFLFFIFSLHYCDKLKSFNNGVTPITLF